MENFMKHSFTVGEITFANFVKGGTGAVIQNRPSHGLAFLLGTKTLIRFEGQTLRAEGNTVVYFPKGSSYRIREASDADCYVINFQMPDGACFSPFAFKVKNAASYLECFQKARRYRVQKAPGYDARIKAELYTILYNMQSEHNLPYANSKLLAPALEYIHSHYYKENISVESLAKMCGISTVHLRNTFLKRFGVPPVKYVNELKLSRAKELLLSRFYSASQACFLSGYNDESYFNREFKKRFGTTPGQFMKANSQGS